MLLKMPNSLWIKTYLTNYILIASLNQKCVIAELTVLSHTSTQVPY